MTGSSAEISSKAGLRDRIVRSVDAATRPFGGPGRGAVVATALAVDGFHAYFVAGSVPTTVGGDAVRHLLEEPAVDHVVQEPIELPADAWSDDGADGPRQFAGAIVRHDRRGVVYLRTGASDGWLVPGGGVEPGESPSRAAAREVREETGVDAAIDRPLAVVEQTVTYAGVGRTTSGYFALFEGRADDPSLDPSGVGDETIVDVAWFAEPPTPLDFATADAFEPYL